MADGRLIYKRLLILLTQIADLNNQPTADTRAKTRRQIKGHTKSLILPSSTAAEAAAPHAAAEAGDVGDAGPYS